MKMIVYEARWTYYYYLGQAFVPRDFSLIKLIGSDSWY